MMIIYVDFDGIIVDTWPVILKKYKEEYKTDKVNEIRLRQLFKKLDWEIILQKSNKNIENIKVLKSLNNIEIKILSKVNTRNEEIAKKKFVNKNLFLDLITLSIDKEKSEIVESRGNILIDDDLNNIKTWEKNGGHGILYSKNNDNKDSDGNINVGFECISKLNRKYIINLVKV